MKITKAQNYTELLQNIKQRIHSAQYDALKVVNQQLIELYWDIGKMIAERQEKDGWGMSIVERLSQDLQKELVGVKGFSARNLWYMRNFFTLYSKNTKLQPMVAEIGWSHNVIILTRCKDNLEREFYIRMTRKFGWSKSVLIHKIASKNYEKMLTGQNNFDKTVPEIIQKQAKLAIKDEYTFGFLDLDIEHSEKDLEQAILSRMDKFLREMGGALAFVGSQYKLEVSNTEYFIDILLYHRHLKALIALELKVGEFLPEYVGKMQFYLAVLDDKVRAEGENPSIGIIICKEKDRAIVEYTLKTSNKPIGVAEYTVLSNVPQNLKKQLPTPKQIAILLQEV
ncbi:MAG: PDDEXK nuclease domain-containing protein [Gammaproteobacteria bacterium]